MSAPPRARLWIVDPSMRCAEEQGVAEVVGDWPGETRLFRPALCPGDGPDEQTGYDVDGAVVLGSAASVHDRAPWIEALGRWLQPIVEGQARIPLLGICFGHQIVAHLAGAHVGWLREDRTKSVGISTSRLEGGRLVDGGELRVVVSHCEEVRETPAGFRVTACRPGSAHDGFEHASLPLYTFQFHPEAREEFASRVGIGAAAIDDRVREDGRRLLAAFRRTALRNLASKTKAGG